MTNRQHISYYADEQEVREFEEVKAALERRSNSDTIRAMVRFVKKFLPKNGGISPKAVKRGRGKTE